MVMLYAQYIEILFMQKQEWKKKNATEKMNKKQTNEQMNRTESEPEVPQQTPIKSEI